MKELVVKDNRLIQASYTLGLVEQRLMLLAIVGARSMSEPITADSLLTVHAEDYAAHFAVERHTAYSVLAAAVETLFNRRATVEVYDARRDTMRPMVVRWVTAMQYEEQLGCITLRFGAEVIPLITRLEQQFTSYELQQVAGLKSAYAIRLYELLMQWKAVGKTPLFELALFRRQLGLVEGEYKLMHQFKQRVLDVAVTQINTQTDIVVSYTQHKNGRTITGFTFSFSHKQHAKKSVPNVAFKDRTNAVLNTTQAWDRLHDLELHSCQQLQPHLTRADVEAYAVLTQTSALRVMQQIKNGK